MRTGHLFIAAAVFLILSVGGLAEPRYDGHAKIRADSWSEDELMPSETHVWTNANTNGDASDPGNWTNEVTTSLRNATYKWTLSAGGIGNEYYCELAGGGDPSIADPDALDLNSVEKTEGTIDTLALDEWGYGDNAVDDTLGYNTVYVRLGDDADPDGKAVDWVEKRRTRPDHDDTAIFNRSAIGSVTTGADYSGIGLAKFITQQGYSGDIGTSASPFKCVADILIHRGSGKLCWETVSSVEAAPDTATNNIVCDSDNQDDALQIDGVVSVLVMLKGDATILAGATISYILMSYRNNPSSDSYLRCQATTAIVFTVVCAGGTLISSTAIPTVVMRDGRLEQLASAAGRITSLFQCGGYVIYNYSDSTGIVIAEISGGTLDFSQDGAFKRIQLLHLFPGAIFIPNDNTTIDPDLGVTANGSIVPNPPY